MSDWTLFAGLAKKHEKEPFRLVFGNPILWNQGVAEKILPKLGPAGFREDMPNFSAFEQASHPQVSLNELNQLRLDRVKDDDEKPGLNSATVVFDATGKLVFKGALTAEEGEALVADLLKRAHLLEAFDVGEAPYAELAGLAKRAKAREDLGGVWEKLEKLPATEESGRLGGFLKARLERDEGLLLGLSRSDPAFAKAQLEALAKELAGSAYGGALAARTKALLASPAHAAAVELRNVRDAVQALHCKSCKGFRRSCAGCRKAREPAREALIKRLEKLLKASEGLEIRPAVQETLDALKG